MAQTLLADSSPMFARLTEGKSTRSWKAAVPAIVIVIAFIGLLTYLASSVSSNSQRAMAAERDGQQVREQMSGLTKQIASLQKDDALAKSPGRTSVIVEPADKKAQEGAPWAVATWGELPDGKSFLRVTAYSLLAKREEGKEFHAWFAPQTGDPIDMGALDLNDNGAGYTMTTELPPVDQGKSVMLTQDPAGSKQPGETLASADLPKLTPMMAAPPSEPAATPSEPAATPQAKQGTTSQRMHHEGEKQQLGK